MKLMLNALAFVTLVAIVAHTPGAVKEIAYLGELPGTRVSAEAINAGGEMIFDRSKTPYGIAFPAFAYEEVKHPPGHIPDQICRKSIGVKLRNGAETFCGLVVLAFHMTENEVRIVLRFKSIVPGRNDCRIEVPVRLLKDWANASGKTVTFDTNKISDLCLNPPNIKFQFTWLNELLANGIMEKRIPTKVEGHEGEATTYESRILGVSPSLMEAFLSIFRYV